MNMHVLKHRGNEGVKKHRVYRYQQRMILNHKRKGAEQFQRALFYLGFGGPVKSKTVRSHLCVDALLVYLASFQHSLIWSSSRCSGGKTTSVNRGKIENWRPYIPSANLAFVQCGRVSHMWGCRPCAWAMKVRLLGLYRQKLDFWAQMYRKWPKKGP